jgi:hypothetical protein
MRASASALRATASTELTGDVVIVLRAAGRVPDTSDPFVQPPLAVQTPAPIAIAIYATLLH